MNSRYLRLIFAASCVVICAFPSALSANSTQVPQKDFVSLGKTIEYIEDPGGALDFETLRAHPQSWKKSQSDEINFGFNRSAWWFRFTMENPSDDPVNWCLEIGYPMLDEIDLYTPLPDGGYSHRRSGDLQPFNARDVNYRNFVFQMRSEKGSHTYYFRVHTTSSVNFPVRTWTPAALYSSIFSEMPALWIYYGMLLVMVLYNLCIFAMSRERSYMYIVLFIASWILFQFTLNGLSFQYLWPHSIWWANNCLPFFMSLLIMWVSLYFRSYVNTRERFPVIDRINLFGIIVPAALWSIVSLMGNYALSIRVVTAISIMATGVITFFSAVCSVRGSREARFFFVGFGVLYAGVSVYVLKTFGVLPSNAFTNWSIQVSSVLVVVLLSLGLADRLNTMKRNLQALNADLDASEKSARERASFLEGVVKTVREISDELVKVSGIFAGITEKFTVLSTEQSATSEEMSATFEELTSLNEQIYRTITSQMDEWGKIKELTDDLKDSQRNISEAGEVVMKSIRGISDSAGQTGVTMKSMIAKMDVINQGGVAVGDLVTLINDISDRINLLSLNASIEAARAGEYGRGFSVVADEIGKLAVATADNSREISSRVTTILHDIKDGMKMVDATKNSIDSIFDMLGDIKKSIDGVSGLLSGQGAAITSVVRQSDVMDGVSHQVASSTREQNASIEQTIKTVGRLSEMAQEIASLNDGIFDLTRSITDKAVQLDDLVKNVS